MKRDILLFLAVAVAALGVGWWLLSSRPGVAVERFMADQKRRGEAAQPRTPNAEAFRATVCAATPCVVVEAGGLTFVFGAGAGTAQGLKSLGVLHASIDAVLLPDLSVTSVEGLAGIGSALGSAGRRDPLKVYGPNGLVPVVDGANLIVSTGPRVRLIAGLEGADEGLSGKLVFDSGVVAVRGFSGTERGSGRVFRVDFEGRSLILAGCQSTTGEILAAARGTTAPKAVLLAGSMRLMGRHPACLDLPAVLQAATQARLANLVLVPADPAGDEPGAIAAWRELLASEGPPGARLGEIGIVLDVSAAAGNHAKTDN